MLTLHDGGRTILMAINAHHEDLTLTLASEGWRRLVDTTTGFVTSEPEGDPETGEVPMPARSLIVFEQRG